MEKGEVVRAGPVDTQVTSEEEAGCVGVGDAIYSPGRRPWGGGRRVRRRVRTRDGKGAQRGVTCATAESRVWEAPPSLWRLVFSSYQKNMSARLLAASACRTARRLASTLSGASNVSGLEVAGSGGFARAPFSSQAARAVATPASSALDALLEDALREARAAGTFKVEREIEGPQGPVIS